MRPGRRIGLGGLTSPPYVGAYSACEACRVMPKRYFCPTNAVLRRKRDEQLTTNNER